MPRYSLKFKMNAVRMLKRLNKGEVIRINRKSIKNVRELCEVLDISSYSLYDWDKKLTLTEIEESEILEEEEIEIPQEEKIEESPEEILMIGSEIRFYGFLASVLRIPRYNSMRLNQLKLSIGLKMIKESKLIDLTKLYNELSKNGDALEK